MSNTSRFFEQTGDEKHSDIQNVQDLEKTINEGLRAALKEDTPDQSIEVFLECLGKALDGERTYIFEQNELGRDDNTYEWVADGVAPEKDNLQDVPPEACASWYRRFRVGKNVIIENLEDISETDSLQYEILKQQDIHSLAVVPLYNGEKVIGFYGVDNPTRSLEYASNMLQTAAYFIVSCLKQRDLFRELQKQSYTVLHALSVDYLGIYRVNFDTDEYEVYRNSKRMNMNWAVQLADGYQTAMERYISEYVVPEDQERVRATTKKEYVLSRLKIKKKFYIRYQVNDSTSGLKHMEIHFSAAEKIDKRANCVIFAQRDVNAEVEKEEKYKLEARWRLEEILEGARTGIWTIELEEGCKPRMYADRTMQSLLGVSDEIEPEECYHHWFKNIESEYVSMVQTAVEEMRETGRSEVTYPWNHPKLGKIYVRCGGVVDKTFTKPGISLNGYHQDITEIMETRKKQEQAIMELLEKVRQANSAKNEFLSHMSHDLRTPINGILGMLEILEKSTDDPERQEECRRKIRVSTRHLLSLVNDVLQISKLESGMSTEMEEPFNLHDILEDCIAMLSVPAAETEIQLVLEEIDLQHGRLIGNPLHLEQILMNIVDNAIKYNKPQGSVYIHVKETSCQDGIAHYCFTIEDTGIGIRKEFKKHIFELFTQENHGARTSYNGVGLGMTIVKKLVDQMEGSIEVESQVGEGSVVSVNLPFQVDEAWSAQPVDEERNVHSSIAGMRVLLVEDNEINCEIMKFILEDAGAEVVTANDGKEAVDTFAAAEQGTFDCILMDLMMPRMSGYEATRVIRGMAREDADLPIIALSANAFEEDIAMSKDAGMDEHLAKPVDIGKVLRVMSRLKR